MRVKVGRSVPNSNGLNIEGIFLMSRRQLDHSINGFIMLLLDLGTCMVNLLIAMDLLHRSSAMISPRTIDSFMN